jgi:hypothetical protein
MVMSQKANGIESNDTSRKVAGMNRRKSTSACSGRRMNIPGVTGLTEAQKALLKALVAL